MSQTQVQLVGNVRTGAVFAGVVTATSANIGGGAVGINSDGINVTGIITATSFSGDGSGLTGVGVGASDNINTTGIITASKISASEFVGSGDNLVFSPTITSFSPIDGATGVSALNDVNIVLTYNQPVSIGTTGTITLRKGSASGTIVESYNVGISTRATVTNQTLTIDTVNKFDYDQEYYVVLPVGTVKNNLEGNSGLLDTYNFTTEAGPVVTSYSPGIGSTNIATDANIILTFDKNIRAGVGTIRLEVGTGGTSIVESYDVSSSNRLTFGSNTLTIDPTSNLTVATNYYVVVPNGAIAGYTGVSTYNFTTVSFALSSISPTNGATNVGVNTNITLTFTNTPTRGTGTIELRSGSVDGGLIENFNAASSGNISVVGNDWILNPTNTITTNTIVYLVIPSTAIQNYVGLNTTGADSYSFTTTIQPSTLGAAYEGGYTICMAGGTVWVVAPNTSEVSRTWYCRDDANTTAQSTSGCTGWFVPTFSQLCNPGYICRTYWDSYSHFYLSSEAFSIAVRGIHFLTGNCNKYNACNKNLVKCVRSFRCVTY
jgi:hypothetical protein